VLLVPTVVGAPFLRRAYNHWGTTTGEGRSRLSGDELIPEPGLSHTRAISIDAPPARVWRWLVQIGQGRGGLYSYDALENLIGCRIHSAEQIVPELQHLAVGDVVRLGPERYPAFRVIDLEPAQTLVLVAVDPATHEPPPLPVANASTTATTWSWELRPTDQGMSTRLLTRQRLTFPGASSILWHLLEPIDFVMERRMLVGIKRRAERIAPVDERADVVAASGAAGSSSAESGRHRAART
jgi:hypothetical protein